MIVNYQDQCYSNQKALYLLNKKQKRANQFSKIENFETFSLQYRTCRTPSPEKSHNFDEVKLRKNQAKNPPSKKIASFF